MTAGGFPVVQFVHPGFEYTGREYVGPRRQRSGMMPWKAGLSKHNRKFMLAPGSLFDPATGENVSGRLCFWGEWEGPSVFWRMQSLGKPLPTIVHAPFRPITAPAESVQNTDPMVFGENFIYSNCMQDHYRVLRDLAPGSIILFGRYAREDGEHSFSLDTCLIVDRMDKLPTHPFNPDEFGRDLLDDAVLGALYSEGHHADLSVHFGRRRNPEAEGPFSFFPARTATDQIPLFPRPELWPKRALENVISPGNMQGIKVTNDLAAADRDAIWHEVVEQVVQQGCRLGHYAEPPPLLELPEAEKLTERSPTAAHPIITTA